MSQLSKQLPKQLSKRLLRQLLTSGIALLLCFTSAQAELQLVLRKGLRAATPIAIVPFVGNQTSTPSIASIIQHDLQTSGYFKVMPFAQLPAQPTSVENIDFTTWQQTNNNYLVIGEVKPVTESAPTHGNQQMLQVDVTLLNLFASTPAMQKSRVTSAESIQQQAQHHVLMQRQFLIQPKQLRAVAHVISDQIFEKITGIKGIFSTRIAYVLIKHQGKQTPVYRLMIADADGANPQALVHSYAPIMSPAWSPNGKKLAYVSLANQQAVIYIVDVASGQQQRVSSFPGINGAPAWSADGKKLALVLSKSGHPKIYQLNVRDHHLQQLTFGNAIDTEPHWAKDGKSLIFTSNRGGEPQIYQLDLATGQAHRLTFNGHYNARAAFTPDGEQIIVLHRDQQGFNIAIQNLANGDFHKITHNGFDSSPSLAPNGQMVIYANDASVRGTLGIASVDGKVQLQLPAPEGTVQEPAWSPFLQGNK